MKGWNEETNGILQTKTWGWAQPTNHRLNFSLWPNCCGLMFINWSSLLCPETIGKWKMFSIFLSGTAVKSLPWATCWWPLPISNMCDYEKIWLGFATVKSVFARLLLVVKLFTDTSQFFYTIGVYARFLCPMYNNFQSCLRNLFDIIIWISSMFKWTEFFE